MIVSLHLIISLRYALLVKIHGVCRLYITHVLECGGNSVCVCFIVVTGKRLTCVFDFEPTESDINLSGSCDLVSLLG